MVNHPPGSVRALLEDAVKLVWHLNELLELMVPYAGTGQSDEVKRHGQMIHASPPWQAQAANLVMDLHAEARRLERSLKAEVMGDRSSVDRGGSSRNTWLALKALLRLTEAVEDVTAADVLVALERWTSRAEVVLGKAEPARRLPRAIGAGEPRCPWCAYLTLRCRPQNGLVYCVNPTCTDEDGRRPRALMGVDYLTGEAVLTWQDGYWHDAAGMAGQIMAEAT
jgi:hypothetical protein